MWCLLNFYKFQQVNLAIFLPLIIIELVGLTYFGYHMKKKKGNLKQYLFLLIFVVPPLEIFFLCYPIVIAFAHSLFLALLTGIGVLAWYILSKVNHHLLKKVACDDGNNERVDYQKLRKKEC